MPDSANTNLSTPHQLIIPPLDKADIRYPQPLWPHIYITTPPASGLMLGVMPQVITSTLGCLMVINAIYEDGCLPLAFAFKQPGKVSIIAAKLQDTSHFSAQDLTDLWEQSYSRKPSRPH